MIFRIYKPAVFQGSLKMKNYFEGWYFKHVSGNLDHVYSFIPGISLNKADSHSFIQVINGITGESAYLSYPLSAFSWSRDKMCISVGDSVFSDEYSILNINDPEITISGKILYNNVVKYPSSLLSPGIMGWYSFVPFMECNHGIVSADHDIDGKLVINGRAVEFGGGKGYIEKDWGTSFPEAWLWIQANNFSERRTSFNFSVAKIPWLGKYFMGFIAFLYHDGKFHLFSTYNNSLIKEIKRSGDSIYLEVSNRELILKIQVSSKSTGELKAPESGLMSRRIRESIDSTVSLSLSATGGKEIYKGKSSRAGLEVIEEVFKYLNE